MRIVNLPTVAVDTTAGGTVIVTDARVRAISGASCVMVNPTVDIVLVDGTTDGTVANSSAICPAGVTTVVNHRSGPLLAISTAGTATVKVAIGCDP